MTTIVSTTGSNTVTLAADRGITSDVIHPDMPKIVQQKTWLIAVAGDARACDVLQYAIKYPTPPKSLTDWNRWMVTKVVPLIDGGIGNAKDEDWEAILVTHGQSFLITNSLGVLTASPYWSIGSGSKLALGVLADSQYSDNWLKNQDIVARHALSVASMHDPFTRGTFDVFVSHHTGRVHRA